MIRRHEWTDADYRENFPNIEREGYRVASEATRRYNCFAWAAGEAAGWWCPLEPMQQGQFWPDGVGKELTLDNFVAAYATVGFERCEGPEHEDGYEKIALFTDHQSGEPTHAARLQPDGTWTSKIGGQHDIEHQSLAALEDSDYGRVACYLRRSVKPGTAVVEMPNV